MASDDKIQSTLVPYEKPEVGESAIEPGASCLNPWDICAEPNHSEVDHYSAASTKNGSSSTGTGDTTKGEGDALQSGWAWLSSCFGPQLPDADKVDDNDSSSQPSLSRLDTVLDLPEKADDVSDITSLPSIDESIQSDLSSRPSIADRQGKTEEAS
jgi:hypothetical protein